MASQTAPGVRWGDYGLWLTASTSDMLARSCRDLALAYIVFGLTGSTAMSGAVQTAGAVTYLAIILFGGVLVDRIDRRRGMLARGITGAVLWLAFAVLVSTHALRLWAVFAIVIVAELTDGLFGTADDAALRSIVPDNAQFARVKG